MSGAGGRGVQHQERVNDVTAARYPRAQPVRVHRHRTQPRRVHKEALLHGRRIRVCLCLNFSDLSGDHKHATTDAHLMAWVVGPRLITSSTTLPFTTTPAVPSRPPRHSRGTSATAARNDGDSVWCGTLRGAYLGRWTCRPSLRCPRRSRARRLGRDDAAPNRVQGACRLTVRPLCFCRQTVVKRSGRTPPRFATLHRGSLASSSGVMLPSF